MGHLFISGSTLTALLIIAMLLHPERTVAEALQFSPYVDKSGNISLPKDFRKTMSHLGSWFVPEGSASGFHDVYTETDSLSIYRDHQCSLINCTRGTNLATRELIKDCKDFPVIIAF